MEGQILENWMEKFRPQLKEESVYYIKYFQVCNAQETFRTVDHPYMMRFTAYTKLHEIKPVPSTFPRYACKIASYTELRNRLNNFQYCSGAFLILLNKSTCTVQ